MTTQTVIAPRVPFLLHSEETGVQLMIRLEGELDLACTDLLEAGLFRGSDTIAYVTLDLGDLDFTDTAGTRAILGLRAAHERLGRDVRIINARPLARRIFAFLGSELTG